MQVHQGFGLCFHGDSRGSGLFVNLTSFFNTRWSCLGGCPTIEGFFLGNLDFVSHLYIGLLVLPKA